MADNVATSGTAAVIGGTTTENAVLIQGAGAVSGSDLSGSMVTGTTAPPQTSSVVGTANSAALPTPAVQAAAPAQTPAPAATAQAAPAQTEAKTAAAAAPTEDIDAIKGENYALKAGVKPECAADVITINGEPADMNTVVEAVPEGGCRMYSGWAGVPENIGYDGITLTRVLADTYGVKPGDTVEIQFKSGMFMPVTKTLTVRGTDLVSYSDSSSRFVVISEKLYKEIYKDFPQLILARCSSPAAAVQTVLDHSAGSVADAKTRMEHEAETASETASMMTIINFLIFFAAGMTFMGVAGDQLIGFEGRRRECAVLLSTSMTRGQLAKMFLLESFTAAGISLILAVPTAAVLSAMFGRIVELLMLTLPAADSPVPVITLGLILWAVFTAVAAFPISRMNRMNIADQLKYE